MLHRISRQTQYPVIQNLDTECPVIEAGRPDIECPAIEAGRSDIECPVIEGPDIESFVLCTFNFETYKVQISTCPAIKTCLLML